MMPYRAGWAGPCAVAPSSREDGHISSWVKT